jgi:hypothetical protein
MYTSLLNRFRSGDLAIINHFSLFNKNHFCTADEDSTQSPQLSPSVISRKDVVNADRTNVPQTGLRAPATSNVTRPSEETQELPKKNLERSLPEEKSKQQQQQQTDQSSTRSSKDRSIEASGAASPKILTTSADIQPSPLKESMQTAQGSRNRQQAGQAVFQSMQDNEKQIEETEAQDNGSDEPNSIRLDSTQISGDARRISDDGPATRSLRDSAQPPAGTLNVPAVFLENIESPRPRSTDQEPMTPMTSPAPAPDAPKGTAPRKHPLLNIDLIQ